MVKLKLTEATRNSLTTEYTYNDASWVTKIDYPNSTNTNYSYNNRGWMTGIELKDNSNNSIFALPYTYDANGNVTQETVGSDTIAYTYDALNRLTFIDRPGTGNDTTYTYDARGNRTQMSTNSITNYLTFNAADELTRVDKPSNAYDTYTYDNNGNCTQMDRYYPQPLLASRTDSTTTTNNNANTTSSSTNTENNNTNPSKLLMTHYPADYAPAPMNKWHNLSPYLPDVSQIDPISAKIASMIPQKAEYDRERRWREIAMPDTTPDETTSFTYSSDNNLTHVDLTNGDDLDFAYDAAGRRLEKKYSTVDSGTTYETKYTYHYIGSQITTIDIYQTQTTGETTTTTKDDQIRIHLGANTRPISFEYYTKDLNAEQTTSATYYYHYDLHGNVIRVTDSSGTTQITYTYDQLGTVVSTTNANSIYNPFTYMGEAQVIQDSEFDTSAASPKTGLYNSGSGYYNPETGTSLGGSGAPAMTNPSSGSMEEPAAQCTKPAGQLGAHAAIAAVAGGVPSSGACSSADVTPEPAYAGLASPTPAPCTCTEPTTTLAVADSPTNYMTGGFIHVGPADLTGSGWITTEEYMRRCHEEAEENTRREKERKHESDVREGVGGGSNNPWDQPGWCADNCAKIIWTPEGMGGQKGDTWVITDNNGKVVARVDKDGKLILFDKNGKEVTDTSERESRWEEICSMVDQGSATARSFDPSGNPTSGSLGMKMSNGTWTGIFIASNLEFQNQFTVDVREGGNAEDFGCIEGWEYYDYTNDPDCGDDPGKPYSFVVYHSRLADDRTGATLKDSDFKAGDYISSTAFGTTACRNINGKDYFAHSILTEFSWDINGKYIGTYTSRTGYGNNLQSMLETDSNGYNKWNLNNGRLKKLHH